jgi:hypothetical protein
MRNKCEDCYVEVQKRRWPGIIGSSMFLLLGLFSVFSLGTLIPRLDALSNHNGIYDLETEVIDAYVILPLFSISLVITCFLIYILLGIIEDSKYTERIQVKKFIIKEDKKPK